MDTEIRVSTESRPWRRKFSRHSCRDSNPRPFSHESGSLTTEISPPPHDLSAIKTCDLSLCRVRASVPCGKQAIRRVWDMV